MFDQARTAAIVAVARSGGIEPAAMLAVVEIESRGEPFEADGETPRFLFEKHVFLRQLRQRAPDSQLQRAIRQGLAVSRWSKANYAEQRTSEGRRQMLARAREIDVECANRSCSWGVGQVMGFNATSLGYASASEMVQQFGSSGGGFQAQVEGMLRFIKKNGLEGWLESRDWTAFALRYNGPAQKQNGYDDKLRAAHRRWSTRALPPPGPMPTMRTATEAASSAARLRRGSVGEDVRDLQRKLTEAGYPLGRIDGDFGAKTEAAVFAFQSANGLPKTGGADDATLAQLNAPRSMPLSTARKDAGQADLLRMGSKTIRETTLGKRLSAALGVIGGGGLLESLVRVNGTDPDRSALQNLGDAAANVAGTVTSSPVVSAVQDRAVAILRQIDVATSTEAKTGILAQLLRSGTAAEDQSALAELLKSAFLMISPTNGLPVVALGVALVMLRTYRAVEQRRLEDHRQGYNIGL